MAPGTKWAYRSADEEGEAETVEVTVTDRTKVIAGVTARVVHDTVTDAEGDVVEDTEDWFAQDRAENLWYLGEDTKELEEGQVTSTEGSWEHGVDGAFAGVALPANPRVGMRYRQEYAKGEAEDKGEILSLTDHAEVPFGRFTGVLLTKDTTPLEPAALENKRYARGIGPVLTIDVPTGGREELVSFEKRAP